jgi:glycosyltransferase involved in cell wall biosynthesis
MKEQVPNRSPAFWKQRNGFDDKGGKLKILCCPANKGGCSFYRIINPYEKLAKLYPNIVEIRFSENPLGLKQADLKTGQYVWEEDWDFADMKWADIVFTQNISNFGGPYTARIVGKAKEFGKLVHYDTDDLLTNLYDGHRLVEVYREKGLSEITKFIYGSSDIVTVTQEKFAHRIMEFCNGYLAVVRNSIDYTLPHWSAPKTPSPKKNLCRVGWAGGIHHEEDVKEFASIPQLVNNRAGRENVRWDFYGKPPPGPDQDPKSKEFKEDWQQQVWLNYERTLMRGFKGQKNYTINYALPATQYGIVYSHMDVAIAPLQMNEFNDSKSDIKVAECGQYAVPLVASNVGCYNETIKNGETGYLISPDSPKRVWVSTLSKVIKDKKHREEMGKNLKEITDKHFDLNKLVHHRLDIYETIMNMRGIKINDN